MYKNKYQYNNHTSLRSIMSMIFIFSGIIIIGYVVLHLLYWLFLAAIGIVCIVIGARLQRPKVRPFWFSRFR